jgi:hypothetical protein
LAFDDGVGGVVFQRYMTWTTDEATRSIIEYLPPEAETPQDLLVPTGDQYLELRDAADGVVWYTRRAGETPESVTETLRSYDLATRSVEEFTTTGGWESGLIHASVAGGTVATYWGGEAYTGFSFLDRSAHPIELGGDPYRGTTVCFDGAQVEVRESGDIVDIGCFQFVEIGGDGLLAYHRAYFDGAEVRFEVAVVEAATGAEVFRTDLERPDQGWAPRTLDLRGQWLIVNRVETGALDAAHIAPLLIELSTGAVREVTLAGRAQFTAGPIEIP